MPLTGIAGLLAGTASGIGQVQERESVVIDQFLENAGALGTGLALNDNLQYRRLFDQAPDGTPLLQRFDNVIANARDPSVGIQALLAQSAAAQPLAQRAAQSPRFGLSQGVPSGLEQQIQGGFLGFNPLLGDRANAQRQQLLNQVPTLAQTNFADIFGATASNGVTNSALETLSNVNNATVTALEKQIQISNNRADRLEQTVIQLQQALAQLGSTSGTGDSVVRGSGLPSGQ